MENIAAKCALNAIRKTENYLQKWDGITEKTKTQSMASKIVRSSKNEPENMRDVPTSRLLRYKTCMETAIAEMQINSNALQRTNGAWSLVPSPDLLNLVGTWEESPMVLQYDDVLSELLLSEPIDEDLIVDSLLSHLPFPSFFVKANGIKFFRSQKEDFCEAEGFFVSEAWIPNENKSWSFEKWLSVVCVVDGLSLPLMIPTTLETYGEVLSAIDQEAKRLYPDDTEAVKAQVTDAQTVLNLILYLGAKDAEVDKVAERLL